MSTNSRIPGGEKNEKSGKHWTKAELEQVYHLFKKLRGIGLHERNPQIIALANNLGRTVRSTEAQAIMFRSLDRGEYGFDKMSKLCKEIWAEKKGVELILHDFKPVKKYRDMSNRPLFPLANWSSESSGGVKRPFDASTGRPIKQQISTPLSLRLEALFARRERKPSPRAIFLIGGPGNGKTDMLEHIAHQIDAQSNVDVHRLCVLGFSSYKWCERVVLDGNEYGGYKFLDLIQDASDSNGDLNPVQSLLEVIQRVLTPAYQGLLLCCMNRGVLDKLRRHVSGFDSSDPSIEGFVKALHRSISPLASAAKVSSWPLDNYDNVYAWPMDVESLFNEPEKNSKSVGCSLISSAVEVDGWSSYLEAQPNRSSISINHALLSNKDFAYHLSRGLRRIEVHAGYRFTFRDSFSLLYHFFRGGLIQKPNQGLNEALDKLSELHYVWRDLYFNRLFVKPLVKMRGRESGVKENLLKIYGQQIPADLVYDAIKMMCYAREEKSATISLVEQDEFQELDPALRNTGVVCCNDITIDFAEIDARFSVGIDEGRDYVSECLLDIEREYLTELAEFVREHVKSSEGSDTRKDAKRGGVHAIFKCIAGRMVKRSIGVRFGLFKKQERIDEFISALVGKRDARAVAKVARAAIANDEKGTSVRYSFNNPVGMQQGAQDVDVCMNFGGLDQLKIENISDGLKDNDPEWPFLVLKYDTGSAPTLIDFRMYEAFYEKGKAGLNASCFKPETALSLDNLISQAVGGRIRNAERLPPESMLEIESAIVPIIRRDVDDIVIHEE